MASGYHLNIISLEHMRYTFQKYLKFIVGRKGNAAGKKEIVSHYESGNERRSRRTPGGFWKSHRSDEPL